MTDYTFQQGQQHGLSALLIALKGKRESIALLLLATCTVVNTSCAESDYKTPLIFAAQYGFTKVLSKLLDKGADVNASDRFGCHALAVACENGHVDIVRLLLQHAVEINRLCRKFVCPKQHEMIQYTSTPEEYSQGSVICDECKRNDLAGKFGRSKKYAR
jgi:ankyrin repeat protein